MNRRESIRLTIAAAAGISVSAMTGCDKRAAIAIGGYVGCFIANRLVAFPNPYARVFGVILKVGSEVLLELADHKGESVSFPIKISLDESHVLQESKQVVFKRKDGSTEPFPVTKEQYG